MRYEGVTCDLCESAIEPSVESSPRWLQAPVFVSDGVDKVVVDVCHACLARPIADLAAHVYRRSYEQNGKTPDRLYECVDCSRRPGSPELCYTCQANRRAAGSEWRGQRGPT